MADINEFFVDWYKLARPDADKELIVSRWDSIENYKKIFEKNILSKSIDLVNIFFGLPLNNEDNINEFLLSIQKNDVSFSIRENIDSFETKVLVGITLIELIQSPSFNLSLLASFFVICTNFQGLRKNLPIVDILEIAQENIDSKSILIRKKGSNIKKISSSPKIALLEPENSPAEQKINELINEFNTIINNDMTKVSKLENFVSIQDEEINILWWVISNYCSILNQQYSEISIEEAALLCTKELSELINFIPGPIASTAFFTNILSKTKNYNETLFPISEIINKSKLTINNWPDINNIENICPLTFGILKYYEANKKKSWGTAFKAKTNINASSKLPVLQIAQQFFYENQLLLLLAKIKF
jgi:hypothetical protein